MFDLFGSDRDDDKHELQENMDKIRQMVSGGSDGDEGPQSPPPRPGGGDAGGADGRERRRDDHDHQLRPAELVTMVLVVEAVNDSLGLAGGERLPLAAVGIILGVDRILDMCRTTVNVWGDATGAKVIDRLSGARAAADRSASEEKGNEAERDRTGSGS
jgi:hypothetical protein